MIRRCSGPIALILAQNARSFVSGTFALRTLLVEKDDKRSSLTFRHQFKYLSPGRASFAFCNPGCEPAVRTLITSSHNRSYSNTDSKQTVLGTGTRVDRLEDTMASRRMQGTSFYLGDTCKLVLHRGDITKWHVDHQTDAIVNAANTRLLGGGGVDGAIHNSAGPELRDACKRIPEVGRGVRCPTGEARMTRGFNLPVSTIIHTVGPIYHDNSDAEEQLTRAYRNSLALAVQEGMKYVAFPAISCGIYGYPVEEAACIALNVVREASADLLEVHFVLFDEKAFFAWMDEAESKLEKF